MNIIDWYKVAIQRFSDFEGRSTRSEFWWFFLCNLLIIIALGRIGDVMYGATGLSLFLTISSSLSSLYSTLILIPYLAVTVRRLHDTGRSGWTLFWVFFPVVGFIILIIFLAQESQYYSNKWGEAFQEEEYFQEALIDFDKDIV